MNSRLFLVSELDQFSEEKILRRKLSMRTGTGVMDRWMNSNEMEQLSATRISTSFVFRSLLYRPEGLVSESDRMISAHKIVGQSRLDRQAWMAEDAEKSRLRTLNVRASDRDYCHDLNGKTETLIMLYAVGPVREASQSSDPIEISHDKDKEMMKLGQQEAIGKSHEIMGSISDQEGFVPGLVRRSESTQPKNFFRTPGIAMTCSAHSDPQTNSPMNSPTTMNRAVFGATHSFDRSIALAEHLSEIITPKTESEALQVSDDDEYSNDDEYGEDDDLSEYWN